MTVCTAASSTRTRVPNVATQLPAPVYAAHCLRADVVANRLPGSPRPTRRSRDFTFNSLRHALAKYRLIPRVPELISPRRSRTMTAGYIEWAAAAAKRTAFVTRARWLDFCALRSASRAPAPTQRQSRPAARLRYKVPTGHGTYHRKKAWKTRRSSIHRLTSLNEVGASRMRMARASRRSTPTRSIAPSTGAGDARPSTHDTKRSEDVRGDQRVVRDDMAWRKTIDATGTYEPHTQA